MLFRNFHNLNRLFKDLDAIEDLANGQTRKMETLFDERLEEPALCQAILTAVSHGADDPERLSYWLDMPYDDLQQQLHFLRLLKLLENNNSVHDPILSNGPTSIPLDSFRYAWAATDNLMIVIQPIESGSA